MKYFISILFVIISIISGFSQGSLSGKIIDSKTGQGLANTNLWIRELRVGTSSDNDGKFVFNNISEGKYNIQVTFIGYSDTIITTQIVNNKSTNIEIGINPFSIEMPTVIVTATKNERNIKDIPNRIEVINSKKIENFAGTNVDDFLRSLTGVNVDRFSGIYSKSASITLRGINSAQRTLILLDGIPMNKTDGGSINWNRIDPENVEKIEVIKGPISALYGSNGISGVVNIRNILFWNFNDRS